MSVPQKICEIQCGAKGWDESQWGFSFYSVENGLLLRMIYHTERLKPISDCGRTVFFCVSAAVQTKSTRFSSHLVLFNISLYFRCDCFCSRYRGSSEWSNMFMNWNSLFSECSEHIKYDIYRESFRMGPNLKQPSTSKWKSGPACCMFSISCYFRVDCKYSISCICI